MTIEEIKCDRCDGCGQIACNEEGEKGEPWSAWEELPPGSDLAVKLGLVWPIPCPTCGGSGGKKVMA